MSQATFFETQTDASRGKAEIVSKYTAAWANIIAPHARRRGQPVGYLDFFAGQGRYDDNSESTPLLLLRRVIDKPNLHDVFRAHFNDANPQAAARLEVEIERLPGVSCLRYRPQVFNETIGPETASAVLARNFPPTLFYVDPRGYKGLTRGLIQGALRHWGCEIIFFFNFNRVNAGVTNECVAERIDELFGGDEADELRARVAELHGYDREQAVMDQLEASIRQDRSLFVQRFTFLDRRGCRISHHLVHVTKNPIGHRIMTDVMANASTWCRDGVPSFRCGPEPEETLLDVVSPLESLKRDLMTYFAGQSPTFGDLYDRHSPGRRFTQANYRETIRELESEGRLTIPDVPGRKRRSGTLPNWVVVVFPATPGTLTPAPPARGLFD
jgi:three-Cys-motif partner protein